ncbi:hypothetical protein F5Y10DRAFT_241851 [Nemania abortiva]|nr:hypothetical protein F5Y10DRAFT_241851 [Nemania abortiva]
MNARIFLIHLITLSLGVFIDGIESEWNLKASDYKVCGSIKIGRTKELHVAYCLLAVLHVLACWMATGFFRVG